MPSYQTQAKFRQVNWSQFTLGGSEGRNAKGWSKAKPVEPITKLDLDVKAGQKEPSFDFAAFRRLLGYSRADEQALAEWENSHIYMGNGKWVAKPAELDWLEWREPIYAAQGQHCPPIWWPTAA